MKVTDFLLNSEWMGFDEVEHFLAEVLFEPAHLSALISELYSGLTHCLPFSARVVHGCVQEKGRVSEEKNRMLQALYIWRKFSLWQPHVLEPGLNLGILA